MAMELDSVREKHQELPHAAGPGLTGLRNLGNTCYIASVFQVLFSLPAFQMRFPSSYLPTFLVSLSWTDPL